jgi:hypothetical protein
VCGKKKPQGKCLFGACQWYIDFFSNNFFAWCEGFLKKTGGRHFLPALPIRLVHFKKSPSLVKRACFPQPLAVAGNKKNCNYSASFGLEGVKSLFIRGKKESLP